MALLIEGTFIDELNELLHVQSYKEQSMTGLYTFMGGSMTGVLVT